MLFALDPMWSVHPIGYVHSPFRDKAEAPRQGVVAANVEATVVIDARYRDALEDLASFDRIWLLFWFDRAAGYRPKVQPPRSVRRRGVLATRSPHRPNPIGLSAVRLVRVEDGAAQPGVSGDRAPAVHLVVQGADLLDGTPVLDVKPYLAYADAFADAGAGWLTEDPAAQWQVVLEPLAEEAAAWVEHATGLSLRSRIIGALALGPTPHAYRRIRGNILSVKEWRVHFQVEAAGPGPEAGGRCGRTIVVTRVASGCPERDLGKDDATARVHHAFRQRFA